MGKRIGGIVLAVFGGILLLTGIRTLISNPQARARMVPVVLIYGAITTGGVLLSRAGTRRIKAARDEQTAADAVAREAALQEFRSLSEWTDRNRWPNLNREVSGVLLGESERCVALTRGVDHMKMHKQTHYEGRAASVSVRVMKGVSVRSGGFVGRPVTSVSSEVADHGSIFVTDRRVVFAGAREVVEVPLKKLADARAEIGVLELLVANRVNPLEFRLTEGLRAPYIAGVAKIMAAVAGMGAVT